MIDEEFDPILIIYQKSLSKKYYKLICSLHGQTFKRKGLTEVGFFTSVIVLKPVVE